MNRVRRARRQERTRQFVRRNPRLAIALVGLLCAGLVALFAAQFSHGTYLGGGWLIAGLAGIAVGVALGVPGVISILRHPALSRIARAWLILAALSTTGLWLPFPQGSAGGFQAFVNVVHAAFLGSAAATVAALTVLMAYVAIRPAGLLMPPPPPASFDGLPGDTRQLSRRPIPRPHSWPGWLLVGGVAGLVAAVVLAGVGGSHIHDATNTAGGWVGASGLAAVCVAIPAALYRWYRAYRITAISPHRGRRRLARRLSVTSRDARSRSRTADR